MRKISRYLFPTGARLSTVLAAALFFLSTTASAQVVLNFDVHKDGTPISIPPFTTLDATSYFAEYSITVENITAGGAVVIRNDGDPSSFISPPSPPNTMSYQMACCSPVTWALDFGTPVSNIGFTRPLLHAGASGVTHPQWAAAAYDASGSVVASTGQSLIASFSDVPAQTFSLPGTGIKRLVFNSDGFHFASTVAVVIDDLTFTPSCQQANAPPAVGQCQITHGLNHWGNEFYAFHADPGGTICHWGCALTSLSMDLISQGVSLVPHCPGLLNCSGQPLFNNDPGTLNDFMTRRNILADYTASFIPADDNNVNFWVTTLDIGAQLGNRKYRFRDTDSNGNTINGLESDVSPIIIRNPNDPALVALDATLCSGHPIIVRVKGSDGVLGHHKVLVVGKQGDEYLINDPAGSYPGSTGTPRACPAPLSGATKPCPFLSDYGWFSIIGFVTDPLPDNMSNLNVVVDTTADLLLVDSLGRRTGLDSTSGNNLREIPRSVHFVDATDDEKTGAPPLGTMHLVNAFQPAVGSYQVTVTGLQQGLFAITINAASSDGTAQPVIFVPGIAGAGSTSTVQIQFSSTPGATSTVARVASFQSTLADISNSLALGLIDNAGIANALTSKIQAAASAASSGQNRTAANILGAFQNQINAQTGKHITGVVPQVLLEDANSLIGQLH